MTNTATHSLAAAIFTSLLLLVCSGSHAEAKSPVASEEAASLLSSLQEETGESERLALANALRDLNPPPVAELSKFLLERTRSSTDEERRAVLEAAGAEVPDATGRFKTPDRQTKKTEKNNDEFDWLAALAKQSAQPGFSDVLADVAVIRALAWSKKPAGGIAILDFAFSEIGLTYRDECGRYLRKMSPYSLPALIHGSQKRKRSQSSIRRYATYQLERLDRQNAHKAFAAATSEDLQIAIVTAFAESGYREAVFAVLDEVDHVAPRVRKAVRAAWMEYVSGRPPAKPPERKLQLPNNKLTRDKEPLWLDHRELAEVAIRKRLRELTGEKTNGRLNLSQLSELLFRHYDDKRAAALNADYEAALALVASKPAEATRIFDRILVVQPEFAKRPSMAGAYLVHAESLEAEGKWREAAVAFGKANMVAPEGKNASEALKRHHLARAKTAEASGQDATSERAIAEEIEESQQTAPQSKLILFAGMAAIAGALVLFFLALALRRRREASVR